MQVFITVRQQGNKSIKKDLILRPGLFIRNVNYGVVVLSGSGVPASTIKPGERASS